MLYCNPNHLRNVTTYLNNPGAFLFYKNAGVQRYNGRPLGSTTQVHFRTMKVL